MNFSSYHKTVKTLFQIINSELKLANESSLANKLSLIAKKVYFFNVWFYPIATANHDTQ